MEVIRQVFIMFLLISAGFIIYKLKIINKEGTHALSSVVIYISNPATLFIAFQITSENNDITGLGYSFLLSLISLVIAIIVTFLLIRGKNQKKTAVEQISLILTNCGFMGIPLVRGVFGDEGVFYLAAFIAVNNLAVWTLGVVKMQGGGFKLKPAYILSILKSPAIIAIAFGVITFVLNVKLPALGLEVISYAANLTTPLAMLVAGATIACVDFKALVKKLRVLYLSFLRLIAIPFLTYAVFLLIPMPDSLIKGVILAAAACPSAAMCVILAVKYDGDSIYASEIFAAATLLSMITLPLIMALPL
ncbi:MAG: AEC family transporter [Oscillospiraceae bacterium]|nr:AEC family transporter [Oscillospiraceae bacterium]